MVECKLKRMRHEGGRENLDLEIVLDSVPAAIFRVIWLFNSIHPNSDWFTSLFRVYTEPLQERLSSFLTPAKLECE